MKSKIENFYKKKLKNGLTILFEKRNLPVVSVSSSIKFGSAFDSIEKKGMAHFIEHLMFKGTEKRSAKEIATEIEKKGGVVNAFTGEEVTCYWNKIPSRHIETGVDISSDLILNPKFDAVEFDKEKKVILEEIKMYHDSPGLYTKAKIAEMLYENPFGMFGTGTEDSLKSICREEIVKKFNSAYGVNNMMLTVVGKAEFDDICKLAEKYFPDRRRILQDYRPVKINKISIETREGIDQAHLVFGIHCPSMNQKERYANEIAMTYLAGGMSSILFQEIREKRGLAYSVSGDINMGKNYGYSEIYAGTMKENIEKITEIILAEIKKLENIKKKDFDETKEQLIGLREVEAESSEAVMIKLLSEEISGKAEEYYEYEEKIKNVKLDDIKKISRFKNYSCFSLIPK